MLLQETTVKTENLVSTAFLSANHVPLMLGLLYGNRTTFHFFKEKYMAHITAMQRLIIK